MSRGAGGGRTFPVEDVFLPGYEGESLREHVGRGVEYVTDLDPDGDVLVFLPGEREIRECADLIEGQGFFNTEAVPVLRGFLCGSGEGFCS